MKIREIKISNLMSFPYVENVSDMKWICFQKPDNNLDMNILIWANWSGKSNFIEIINQFTKNLILDYTFDQNILKEQKKDEFKQAIKLNTRKTSRLSKHTKFQDKPSKIEIHIELFDNDFDNIAFICKNTNKINAIIEKYSEISYRFPQFNIDHIKNEIKEVVLKAEFDEKNQNFVIERDELTPMEFFSLVCTQEQELIYICMQIHNKREKKADEPIRYPLNNSFSILSSQRDLVQRQFLNQFQDFDDYIFKKKDETSPNLEWYFKCLHKIWNIIKKRTANDIESKKQDDKTKKKRKKSDFTTTEEQSIELDESREKRLYESKFWKTLSSYVEKFTHKTLSIQYIQWWINLQLQNPDWETCYFDDLGAWQQSLLLIIFSLLWNDLKDWFMVIDEPELHTHPQIQKELALLLNHLSEQRWTQFILSTYSALFINEENITNVYRFSKEQWWTKVFTPNIKIASDDARLVHLLRYENLSKIFFVNKIIMVEWDSDLYFFSHYLKRLQGQEWREYITWTYEILNINGKGSYKSRHKFLNRFGIDNYFIWDWDNTVDYWFFTPKELWKYYQLANRHIKNDRFTSGDYYNRLVFTIKKFYPQKYQRIIEWIEDLYRDNVYILKLWAIESYPCLERKWLQYMVNFCNLDFEHWLVNPRTQSQRTELFDIFSSIFNRKEKQEEIWQDNPF